MPPDIAHPSPTADPAWGVRGDPALITKAARRLWLGIELGVFRAHPAGESTMVEIARLLEAVAFSLHSGGPAHHRVATAATEIAHHVLTGLRPAVQVDAPAEDRPRRLRPLP